MANAKASTTAGFIAVVLAAATASAGAAGEPLVEMERDRPAPAAGEQGVGEAHLPILLQQRSR